MILLNKFITCGRFLISCEDYTEDHDDAQICFNMNYGCMYMIRDYEPMHYVKMNKNYNVRIYEGEGLRITAADNSFILEQYPDLSVELYICDKIV